MKLRNDPVMNGARARARNSPGHRLLGGFRRAEDGTGAKRHLRFADQESDSDIVHHDAVRGSWFRRNEEMSSERPRAARRNDAPYSAARFPTSAAASRS